MARANRASHPFWDTGKTTGNWKPGALHPNKIGVLCPNAEQKGSRYRKGSGGSVCVHEMRGRVCKRSQASTSVRGCSQVAKVGRDFVMCIAKVVVLSCLAWQVVASVCASVICVVGSFLAG